MANKWLWQGNRQYSQTDWIRAINKNIWSAFVRSFGRSPVEWSPPFSIHPGLIYVVYTLQKQPPISLNRHFGAAWQMVTLMMMMFRICLFDAANSRVPQQSSPLRRTNRNMTRMDNKNSGKVWSDLRRRRMQKTKPAKDNGRQQGHLPFNLRFLSGSGGYFRRTNTLRIQKCDLWRVNSESYQRKWRRKAC